MSPGSGGASSSSATFFRSSPNERRTSGLTLLRKQGRSVEYSVFREETTVDWTIISDDKELDVLGAHLGPGTWPTAIRMIEDGRLPLDDICTHQLPLREFARGLDLVSRGDESIKVTLMP